MSQLSTLNPRERNSTHLNLNPKIGKKQAMELHATCHMIYVI